MISRLVYLKGLHPSRIGCSSLAIDCSNEQSITSVNPVSVLHTRYIIIIMLPVRSNTVIFESRSVFRLSWRLWRIKFSSFSYFLLNSKGKKKSLWNIFFLELEREQDLSPCNSTGKCQFFLFTTGNLFCNFNRKKYLFNRK